MGVRDRDRVRVRDRVGVRARVRLGEEKEETLLGQNAKESH